MDKPTRRRPLIGQEKLSKQPEPALLAHVPEVLECHLVAGEFDYLVKTRITDMRDYRDLLGRILLQLPMAMESRSYVVMEEIKDSHILPL